MNRAEKQAAVIDLQQKLANVTTLVVMQASGLSADETRQFRIKVRAGQVTMVVIKNTLARLAVAGTPLAGIMPLLKGQTALAFSTDAVAPAKIVAEYAKSNDKVKIIGGAFQGQVLDANGIKTLATLPSLDELRAKLLGLLQAPATRIAVVVKEPAAKLARVMAAKGRQG